MVQLLRIEATAANEQSVMGESVTRGQEGNMGCVQLRTLCTRKLNLRVVVIRITLRCVVRHRIERSHAGCVPAGDCVKASRDGHLQRRMRPQHHAPARSSATARPPLLCLHIVLVPCDAKAIEANLFKFSSLFRLGRIMQ